MAARALLVGEGLRKWSLAVVMEVCATVALVMDKISVDLWWIVTAGIGAAFGILNTIEKRNGG
jgi:hypothetical protein